MASVCEKIKITVHVPFQLFSLKLRTLRSFGRFSLVDMFTGRYWSSVKRAATQICHSLVQAQQREKEEADTVTALASLSMGVVKETDK